MQIYKVGGAIRDALLGLPVTENDWLVVGATVKQMAFLGYRQVGKSFPVFIHPKSGEEYALARKEKKTQKGHTGFSFEFDEDVTLEEDLQRRDLTINAMVKSDRGKLFDLVGGKKDLKKKVLRHISPAFSEDPLRVLRVARFKAKLAHLSFTVAPETLTLMRKMVRSGELSTLTKERVWLELHKALVTQTPAAFFDTLQACGARAKLFPTINKAACQALDKAAAYTEDSEIRFACLMFQETNFTRNLHYRAPKSYIELAKMLSQYHHQVDHIKRLSTQERLTFLLTCDALRRPVRFEKFLLACEAVYLSNPRHTTKKEYWQRDFLLNARDILASIDISDLIVKGFNGQVLVDQIAKRRIEQLSTMETP